MTPQQYERLTDLFHAALEIAPDQRRGFLDQISEDDVDLRRELESLLAVSDQRPSFSKPPEDIAAAYLAHQSGGSASNPSLAPNARIDRYEIRSLLGKGGMAEVYLAEDTRLHRKVALKILPGAVADNQDRMRRFEQEATAAAALNHPHIAHIYEIGEGASTHFIAMEYIDGETLRDKIHRDKAPLATLLKYLTQAGEGLTKAHAAGIVHRDLKPDNIMITRDDYAKVLDFGLAKLVEPRSASRTSTDAPLMFGTEFGAQHSMAGMVMGTAGYMSPEQAEGKIEQVDHRSDIFSFGCILFEAVTEQKPFADESVIESLRKAIYEEAPPIKDLNPKAPPDLQEIIRRCLAKKREERYQAIEDVVVALNKVRAEMTEASDIKRAAQSKDRTEILSRQTNGTSSPLTSSAEYIASKIKRHKNAVAIILVTLLIGFGYVLYRLAGPLKSDSSSTSIKLTRFTATGKVWSALISPDGKSVVYTVDDAGQQSIWVRQVAASSNEQIVPASDASYGNFSFTRDGKNIYFSKSEKNRPVSIYQMPASGGPARKVVENVSSRAAVSWDDKRIAFIRGGFLANENSLVVANCDGTEEQVIDTRKSPGNFYPGGLAWTPNGQSIAAIVGSNVRHLVEVPLDGSAEKLLNTPKWVAVVDAEWLSDGKGLIVIAKEQSRSGPSQVWYLSYPGGEAHRLTSDFNNYANLSLAANGKTLLVTKQETTSHIWVAPDGDSNRAKQLTTGTGRQDGFPSVNWTTDGRIIYVSNASGSRHIWIMNGDGSDQRQLTEGAYEDQGSHVSPDGRYIVFTSNRSGTFHIYRINIDGSNLKQLTNGTGEASPFYSPDGKWVLCSSSDYSSWKVPADGGDLVSLNSDGWASSMSPNGQLVVYVRPVGPGGLEWNLTVSPFAGGPPRKIFEMHSANRPNSRWSPDGRAIIYNLTDGSDLSGITNLWIQQLDGGPPKQLTHFISEIFFSYDWSTDGKQLVYGRGSTTSDVVLITDFR